MCSKCGGEGGDIIDCNSFAEAKRCARAMEKDGMEVENIEQYRDGEWREIDG